MSAGRGEMPVAITPTKWSPTRRRLTVAVPCAVVALGATLVAVKLSSSHVSTNGPMGSGGSWTEVCLPLRPGQQMTTGTVRLGNSAGSPVIVDSFTVRGVSGVKVVGSAVVPLDGTGSIGAIPGYPPLSPGFPWDHHRPVVGSRIAPHTDEAYALIVGL